MSEKTLLLINRDGSLHPTHRVIPTEPSAYGARYPHTWRVARLTLRLYGNTDETTTLPPNETVYYRLVGEAGPYVVYEEYA